MSSDIFSDIFSDISDISISRYLDFRYLDLTSRIERIIRIHIYRIRRVKASFSEDYLDICSLCVRLVMRDGRYRVRRGGPQQGFEEAPSEKRKRSLN